MPVRRYPDADYGAARRRSFRRRLAAAGLLLLALWLIFFDSHSLYRRLRWTYEAARLRTQNEALRQEITVLEEQLRQGISDEMIERIAREQYGMRRPGETIYRVED
jgi:cell division protein FtsB